MPTEIKACTCAHEYQDEKHGKNRRVHNSMANGQLRCTVCGKVFGASAPKKK